MGIVCLLWFVCTHGIIAFAYPRKVLLLQYFDFICVGDDDTNAKVNSHSMRGPYLYSLMPCNHGKHAGSTKYSAVVIMIIDILQEHKKFSRLRLLPSCMNTYYDDDFFGATKGAWSFWASQKYLRSQPDSDSWAVDNCSSEWKMIFKGIVIMMSTSAKKTTCQDFSIIRV